MVCPDDLMSFCEKGKDNPVKQHNYNGFISQGSSNYDVTSSLIMMNAQELLQTGGTELTSGVGGDSEVGCLEKAGDIAQSPQQISLEESNDEDDCSPNE